LSGRERSRIEAVHRPASTPVADRHARGQRDDR
jgi:hypothetical protein